MTVPEFEWDGKQMVREHDHLTRHVHQRSIHQILLEDHQIVGVRGIPADADHVVSE
jgi:hypothetical protein